MEFVSNGVTYVVSPIVLSAIAAFCAAVTAALISFFGVRMSNANSRRQLQMQLDDAAKQKERDRKMSLRREIFLEAAEWGQATILATGDFVDLRIKAPDLVARLDKRSHVPTKVELVGNTKTVELCLSLSLAFTSAYGKLAPQRRPLEALMLDIEKLWKRVQETGSDTPESAALKALHGRLIDEFATKRHAFNAQVYDETQAQIALCGSLLMSMREELEMPIDIAAYASINDRINKTGRKAVDDFVAADRNALTAILGDTAGSTAP